MSLALVDEFKAFVFSSKVAITQLFDEPQSHREYAIFAVKACPFVANPSMRPNRKGMRVIMATHVTHPSMYVVWVTQDFSVIPSHGGATKTWSWNWLIPWVGECNVHYGTVRPDRPAAPPRARRQTFPWLVRAPSAGFFYADRLSAHWGASCVCAITADWVLPTFAAIVC